MNARRIAAVVFAVALVGLVVGCSSQTTTGGQTNPEPPGPIELTSADTGSTQQMQTGQQLLITLEANPTTGYDWAVDGEVPAQLEQLSEPEYSSESTAMGAGGTQVWRFSAKEAGQGTLKLKYWRSFEPNEAPVETFDVTVDVK